jgi:hypothetical protein
MPPEIAERVRSEIEERAEDPITKAMQEIAQENKATADKFREALVEPLRTYSAPVLKELLEEIGKELPNPIVFEHLKGANAKFNPKTRTLTLDIGFVEKCQKNATRPNWDGGGFFVDRKTLERIEIPSRLRLKSTLAHEMAHDTIKGHGEGFHELMYSYLTGPGFEYTDQLYVFKGKEGYARPKNRPDMIDYDVWEQLLEKKRGEGQ